MAGAGVEHDVLVDMVSKKFTDLPSQRSDKEIRIQDKYEAGFHIEAMHPDDEVT